jgi:hypothetical protein
MKAVSNPVPLRRLPAALAAAALCALAAGPLPATAGGVVVSHDINTLASFVAGAQESAFAVNVAQWLTSDGPGKSLLLFESNPGDGTRNFAPTVLAALTTAGYAVTVTSNYATAYASYDAVFVAQDFPSVGFLDNAALAGYVAGGGGVYLAGGVGPSPAAEANGWNGFLQHYGLALDTLRYNGLSSVTITGGHPIFDGITQLGSGNGQSIVKLDNNPNSQILQFAGEQGVYAVATVPEPSTAWLLGAGLAAFVGWRRRSAP